MGAWAEVYHAQTRERGPPSALAEIYMIYNLSLLTIMIELKLHSLNFIFMFYAVVFDL